MCCIFTCCGWMIDLIQRLWTFTMSCCISSAVCCSLLTASMSGIALGYNYSLAEYIDLKETNVSIYLKRGVFDDDIADDMDWRRSGHMPVEGHIRDQNLLTGAPDDESTPLRAGRRLDDTIFESNDKNSFEGALMKLTAKPPADRRSETYPELNMQEVFSRLPSEPIPIDQLKAVQSAINMQKAAEAERRVQSKQKQPNIQDSGRRMLPRVSIDILPREEPTSLNSLRLAVPDQGFHNPGNWVAPKYNSKKFSTELFDDYSEPLTLPTPVSARPAPIRPSKPRRPNLFEKSTKPTLSTHQAIIINSAKTSIQKDFKDDILDINEKLLLDKFDDPSFRDEEIAHKMKKGPNQSEEDYEDDIKGIPIRKKRNIVKKQRGTRDYVKKTFISKLYYLASSSPVPSKKIINVPRTTYQDKTEIVNTLENTDKLSDTTFLKLIMSCTIS